MWLNNCVGRRNYRYFFAFVSLSIVLGLFLSLASLGQLLHYMDHNEGGFVDAIKACPVPFAMFCYGFLVIPYPVTLGGYHLFLMGRGETTREFLKSHSFLPKDRYRAFDTHHILKNWLVVLLRPRSPTYLRFKDRYVEGDPRFASREGHRTAPLNPSNQGGGMELQNMTGSRTWQRSKE